MTVAKLVYTADIHINAGRWGRLDPGTNRNDAHNSAYRCWMAVCQYVADTKPDAFMVGGDLFANARPSPESQEMVADGLKLVPCSVPVIIVPGNHEYLGLPARHRHVLRHYAELPNVTVFDEPALHTLTNGVQLGSVPWPRRPHLVSELDLGTQNPDGIDDMVAALTVEAIGGLAERVDPSRPAILFGHATIGDAVVGSAKRGSEMSIRAVFHEPVLPIEAVDEEPWSASLWGHIHKAQTMGQRSRYVGSPDRIDFSEEGEEKGFAVVDIAADGTVTVETVPTPARRFRTVRIGDGLDMGPEADYDADLPVEEGEIVRVVLAPGVEVDETALRSAARSHGVYLTGMSRQPLQRELKAGQVAVSEGTSMTDGLDLWIIKEGLDQVTANQVRVEARRYIAQLGIIAPDKAGATTEKKAA